MNWIVCCLFYLIVAVFEWSSGERTVPYCLLRCKDEHMLRMDSEWSMDFAFPLLSLLRANGSEEAAYNKATQICFHNKMLGNCINRCNASAERDIMKIGLEPWDKICENLKTLRTQFSCWKFNIETLTLACLVESHRLRLNLRQLTFSNTLENVDLVCKQMQVLAICTVREYGQSCGEATTNLLVTLFDSAHGAMTKMLKKKWNSLPPACTKNTTYEPQHLRSSALRSYHIYSVFLITLWNKMF